MLDNWFVQEIAWAAMCAVIAAAMTALRSKRRKIAEQALFAVASFIVLMGGRAVYLGMSYLQTVQPVITDENSERTVRSWIDKAGWNVQRTDPTELIDYGFTVRLPQPSDIPILVARSRGMPGFINIESSVALSPEHQQLYDKLAKTEAEALNRKLTAELNRLNFAYEGLAVPLRTMAIVRQLPITNELTEYRLVTAVQEVTSAVVLMRQLIADRFPEPINP